MAGWDRRAVLAGATALAGGWGAAKRALAAMAIPPAPKAKLTPTTDVYFGESVVDPYRWMENGKDPDWLPYLKAQNDRTRAVLDAIPGRDRLLARIQQLSGDTAATIQVQRAGERLFYEQRRAGADNFKLFVREAGRERVLVDPVALSTGKSHVSLDWWRASPDGMHVVYGLSKDGSEDSLLHIMTVADGGHLPETITNTQDAHPRWLNDGSGFFYTQLTHPVDTPERFLDAQARFHRLGTDAAADPILMKRGMDAAIAFDRIQQPGILVSEGSDYALLLLGDVRPEARIYIAPTADAVAGKAKWVEVATFADEVTDMEMVGGDLYLLSLKNAPRGRVLKLPIASPVLANASEVVPQGPLVIQQLSLARDGLYLRLLDGGVTRVKRLSFTGALSEVALPFEGSSRGLLTNPNFDGALFSYAGWLNPAGIWSVDASGKVENTGLTPASSIDTSPYATATGFGVAKDGTKIPYHLIYRKGLRRDGSAPAWISAYGSYGSAAYAPSFQGKALALVDAGFIVGYAYVRGGGEFGREWHKAGQHANKPNTWRDLIAVCETLVAEKWTAPQRLAIGGRSAGGITMGMAMNERPDLFAAVIDGVGWSNPLRYVMEQNSFGEEPEWGAINDVDGYRWLKAIDSYQHVKDGQAYPAVLLTTGVTDPRVAPFHVAKMTARLQAASSSANPILLRVDYDAGHGMGSTRSQEDREAADTYAFLLWRTGVKGWEPV